LGGRSYLLELYFFTSWGPGAKPLVENFLGMAPVTSNSKRLSEIIAAKTGRSMASKMPSHPTCVS
jgi:hypothetical protein